MEAFFEYLLKASCVLTIFYTVYRFILKNETFFKGNRHFLLVGILSAFIFPLVHITKYVTVAPLDYSFLSTVPLADDAESLTQDFNWVAPLAVIYCIGVIIFSLKFIAQLRSLLFLIKNSEIRKEDGFVLVKINKNIPPFSFFQYIIYNPYLYRDTELAAILKHEKAHSAQWHSLDILLSCLMAIFLWPNPVGWWYRKNIRQNLEFLADASAAREVSSLKAYQYTLLKVSGNPLCPAIANNFYSSLIKKRIVMLHRKPSHKGNLFKYGLVLPLLTGFVFLFNIKNVAKAASIPQTLYPVQKTMKPIDSSRYIITKEMTDAEIASLAEEIKKEGGKLIVKKLKRNGLGQITSIKVTFKFMGGHVIGNYDDTNGIRPIHFGQNESGGLFITSNKGAVASHTNTSKRKSKTVIIATDEDQDNEEEDKIVIKIDDKKRISAASGKGKNKVIEIEEENGNRKITVDGKEVSEEELRKMQEKEGFYYDIKTNRSGEDQDNNNHIIVIKDSDDENDIEVVEEDGTGFFFIDTDGNKKPLFFIDGKEATEEEVKELSPNRIESMNVYKGEKAVEKYGKEAKDGVVEITTKKE